MTVGGDGDRVVITKEKKRLKRKRGLHGPMVTVLRVSQLGKFKPVYQIKGKPDIKCKPRLSHANKIGN